MSKSIAPRDPGEVLFMLDIELAEKRFYQTWDILPRSATVVA